MTDDVATAPPEPPTPPPPAPVDEPSQLTEAVFEVRRAIVGQDRAIERLFTCLIADSGCMLESPPGLGRSATLEALSAVVEADLEPSVAALAESATGLDGGFAVVAAETHDEDEPAKIPLSVRDRFLMKIVLRYPTPAEELEIVRRAGAEPAKPRQVLSARELSRLQGSAAAVYVDPGVIEYAVSLAQATRDPAGYGMGDLTGAISRGVSPRATIGLVSAGRALAVLRGRAYALPQDVFDVAPEVMRHRLVLSEQAEAQRIGVENVLARILGTVAAPRISPSQASPEA